VKARDLVVVGASAGGIEALRELMKGLPADLPAAVLVVIHLAPGSPSFLADILQRDTALPVRKGADREPIRPGTVYVASPNRHLAVHDGRILLGLGPVENRHRPAVDVLFRSAARAGGSRVAGVILSGMLDDGSAGLAAIKACGGVALVQSPEEALYADMPLNALRSVDVDHCLPVAGLAEMLGRLAGRPVNGQATPCTQIEVLQVETELGMAVDDVRTSLKRIGTAASIRCPECQGPLWEIKDSAVLRYRCEVGHALSERSLEDGQNELIERALWSAVSALEEKAVVARRIADRSRANGLDELARQYEARARKAVQETQTLSHALRGITGSAVPEPAPKRTSRAAPKSRKRASVKAPSRRHGAS